TRRHGAADLLGCGRLSDQFGTRSLDLAAAPGNRDAEGGRLFESRNRPTLLGIGLVRDCARWRARRNRRSGSRAVRARDLRRNLRFSEACVRIPSITGGVRHADQRGRGNPRRLVRRAKRDPPAAGRGHACTRPGALSAEHTRTTGAGCARGTGWIDGATRGAATPAANVALLARRSGGDGTADLGPLWAGLARQLSRRHVATRTTSNTHGRF